MRKLLFFILPFLVISLSSCFQLIEEITMNGDGSGEMQITLNLSQSKSKVASLLLLDSVNGHKIPREKDIQKFINETVDFLKKSEGITNVRKTVDMQNFIASVTFNFTDVSKLNGVTKKLLGKEKISVPEIRYSYDKTTALFSRTYKYAGSMKDGFNKLKPKDQEIFKTATYTSIFRYPVIIVSGSNPASKISPSKKAIMLNTPAMELINGTANISNIIQLSH